MTDNKNRFTRIDGLEALVDDDAALKSFILEMNRIGREIEAKKKKKAKRDLNIAPSDLSSEEQADYLVNELFRRYSKSPDIFIPKD